MAKTGQKRIVKHSSGQIREMATAIAELADELNSIAGKMDEKAIPEIEVTHFISASTGADNIALYVGYAVNSLYEKSRLAVAERVNQKRN